MELIVTVDGDPTQVKTNGQVAYMTVDHQRGPFEALLGPDVYRRNIVMDMSNSDYIDSSGVGWLLKCQKQFREAGGRFVIHSATPMVMQVLRLMRLTKVLRIAPDAYAAEAALRDEVQT